MYFAHFPRVRAVHPAHRPGCTRCATEPRANACKDAPRAWRAVREFKSDWCALIVGVFVRDAQRSLASTSRCLGNVAGRVAYDPSTRRPCALPRRPTLSPLLSEFWTPAMLPARYRQGAYGRRLDEEGASIPSKMSHDDVDEDERDAAGRRGRGVAWWRWHGSLGKLDGASDGNLGSWALGEQFVASVP